MRKRLPARGLDVSLHALRAAILIDDQGHSFVFARTCERRESSIPQD